MTEVSNLGPNPKVNVIAAFMPLPNEELIGNAFIASKMLESLLASVIVKRFEVEAFETREGSEKITREIPDILEDRLHNLDEKGIIKTGMKVKKNDILVGKASPENDFNMTPEKKLLRAIFGEPPSPKDTSLRMPYEDEGIVISTGYLSRQENNKLPSLVNEIAEVDVAFKKELKVGDLLRDPKDNKGVVIKIADIPIHIRGYKSIDIIGGPSSSFISSLEDPKIKSVWYDKEHSRIYLYSEKITSSKQISFCIRKNVEYEFLGKAKIGCLTLQRLTTLVEKKITVRSIGPYSIVSQQPDLEDITRYKKGACISEEELSALKNYPALFKEALTIRSDAVKERVKAYEELVKNGEF